MQEQVREGDLAEYPQKDFDFHKFIIKASTNEKLIFMNEVLHKQVYLIRYRSGVSSRERAIQALQEHEAVLDAFKKRDPVLAENRMRQHIKKAKENILRMSEPG